MKSLVSNIRIIRKQKGISQESLAYDLGIDYSTYGKIERGVIALTVDRLEKIAGILGVTIQEIYSWDKSTEQFSVDLSMLREKYDLVKEELDRAKKEIDLLKQQLADKEKIILLLENKLNKSSAS